MKNKAFTMVELLGVIVILAILVLVSMPSLLNSIKGNEKSKYEAFLKSLYNASEVYVVENPTEFDWNASNNTIALTNLINGDYISGNYVNPNTNKKIREENSTIKVSKDSQNLLVFEYVYVAKD